MKFCDFIKILYENKNDNITTQEDFVVKMFNSTGVSFSYSEGYGKNLLSGKKPLSQDIRDLVGEDFDHDGLMDFFYNNEKETRLNDFFSKFNIATDVEKHFNVLCLCFVSQFILFMKNGNETKIEISSMYEIYLDEISGKHEKNTNINALLSSKRFIFNAIESLSNISPDKKLLKNESYFESFFSAIKSAHYSFTRNADFNARQIYRAFCKGAYDINRPKDKFLFEASTQSYETLDLIKKLNYAVYDNLISKDKFDSIEISVFNNEEEDKKKLEVLNKLVADDQDEAPFSEYISFQIKGNENNLLNDYYYILLKTIKTFEFLEEKLGTNDKISYLNNEINTKLKNLRLEFIQYTTDGTFYKKNNTLEYASSIDPLFGTNNDDLHFTGDELLKPKDSHLKEFKKINEKMRYMFCFYSLLLKEGKMNSDSMMQEIYTINKNGTYRLYLIPTTCKAKLHRFVRKICSRIKKDETISFFTIGISIYRPVNSNITDYKDALCAFSYENEKIYSLFSPIESIVKNKEQKISQGNYLNPIFLPLIAAIEANKKKAA